jgi:hypothetical protein
MPRKPRNTVQGKIDRAKKRKEIRRLEREERAKQREEVEARRQIQRNTQGVKVQ